MARSFSIIKLAKTFDRIHDLIGASFTGSSGLRRIQGWMVADGEPAARDAIHQYLARGGVAPPEVTMVAHLVALYGGQIALAGPGVMLFLPHGFPGRILLIAEAAGYQHVEVENKPYQLLRWPESF